METVQAVEPQYTATTHPHLLKHQASPRVFVYLHGFQPLSVVLQQLLQHPWVNAFAQSSAIQEGAVKIQVQGLIPLPASVFGQLTLQLS
jgi:hypothetical protein